MSVGRRNRIFAEFSKWGFDQKGWAAGTRRRYVYQVSCAEVWLHENLETSLLRATPKELQRYLFQTTPDAGTRNSIRAALVGFGNFLVDQGFVTVNAALSLPRLPEPRRLPKPLSVEESRAVVHAARILRHEAIVYCYLYGGMRKTEARLLERRCIEDSGVRVFGKGSKERIIPQHPILVDALQRQLASHNSTWIFPSPRLVGHPVSDSLVGNWITEVGEVAGVPSLHPHQLRHTFATRLSDKEVALEVIQDLLGHSDPKTTRIYTKVRSKRFDVAIEMLDFEAPAESR